MSAILLAGSTSRYLSVKHQARYTDPWLLCIRCVGPALIVSPFFQLIGGNHPAMNIGCPRESHRDYPTFKNRRLLEPIGNIPPAEAEEKYYAQRDLLDMVASIEAIALR